MRAAAFLLAIGIAAFPGAAAAQQSDFCTQAWVIRNMIFDRLGHCFGSVAGRMLFDNSDCTMSGPTPPADLARDVARIREGEASAGCRIDTSQPPTAAMRQTRARFSRFIDLPVPDHVGGYACWGYKGPAFRLLAGASLSAPEVGVAQTGQSVVTTYWGRPGGWVFGTITTGPGGSVLTEGWFAGVDIGPDNCELVAG
jgi:hypothetical protein